MCVLGCVWVCVVCMCQYVYYIGECVLVCVYHDVDILLKHCL